MTGCSARGTQDASEWVKRFAPLVPAGSPVLDIAAGSGRHSRYFRDRGHPVTAVDRGTSRLQELAGVTADEADLESDGPWPVPGRFGGVVVTNYLWRPILGQITAAVADGGILIYETFASGNEVYGKPSREDYLLRPGELLSAIGDLQTVAYSHGLLEQPRRAVVQRICAFRSLKPQVLDWI